MESEVAGGKVHRPIGKSVQKLIGMILLVIGSASVATAAKVPEIDPTSGVSALALIAGVLLIIRGRRKQ